MTLAHLPESEFPTRFPADPTRILTDPITSYQILPNPTRSYQIAPDRTKSYQTLTFHRISFVFIHLHCFAFIWVEFWGLRWLNPKRQSFGRLPTLAVGGWDIVGIHAGRCLYNKLYLRRRLTMPMICHSRQSLSRGGCACNDIQAAHTREALNPKP